MVSQQLIIVGGSTHQPTTTHFILNLTSLSTSYSLFQPMLSI